jgi:UPF0176 protein
MDYQVLLYYKYVEVNEPELLKAQQIELCKRLGLQGRIIVSTEGINGTLEGSKENTELYIEAMTTDARFEDVHWKRSIGTGEAFPRLSVKVRPELVSAHLDERDVDPRITTGKYLQPEQLHEWFEQGKEFYIVDMRNDYEFKVGHFDNSILPSLTNFRDLPAVLPELESLKDKTVLTVCTGGVRCEKASGFLVKNGFNDVYQLAGGIVSYMEKYPNQNFLGKLYTFDGRVTIAFNVDSDDHQVIGKCDLCSAKSDFYVDCAYKHCTGTRHFIACKNCRDSEDRAFCSDNCRQLAVAEQAFSKHSRPLMAFN